MESSWSRFGSGANRGVAEIDGFDLLFRRRQMLVGKAAVVIGGRGISRKGLALGKKRKGREVDIQIPRDLVKMQMESRR